jgi:hypothetical protein
LFGHVPSSEMIYIVYEERGGMVAD